MMSLVTLVVGIIISIVGMIFMRPIAIFLGAENETIEHCVIYGRIIIGFNTAFMLQNLFQSFLITAEKPKLGLWVTVAAGVTNMVLDALFVGVFKWGVAGAAIATGLSQCIGGLLPFIYFLRPNNSLLRFVKTKIEFRPVIDASANGASELVSNVTASIVGMLYNYQLLKYAGEDGVSLWHTYVCGIHLYFGFYRVRDRKCTDNQLSFRCRQPRRAKKHVEKEFDSNVAGRGCNADNFRSSRLSACTHFRWLR